ncbi:hypothetical protein EV182_002641 [Spiromyces aspiralis]|uniref:Uncharacterized protein n=1 Tax=Spiromyces aspiralis TaxID=68401 RepID=A0ACC1HS70_9FUNG|nr:hypothetical protein EV182_002641 [Spiromyces aspiralis]
MSPIKEEDTQDVRAIDDSKAHHILPQHHYNRHYHHPRRHSSDGSFMTPHITKVVSRPEILGRRQSLPPTSSANLSWWDRFTANLALIYGKVSDDPILTKQNKIYLETGYYPSEDEVLSDIFVNSRRPSLDLNHSGESYSRIGSSDYY